MAQPGLFLVHSKITAPDVLKTEQFLKWYDEAHIPDCLATSGIHSAFRYRAAAVPLTSHADKPHLVIYPLQDVDFPRSGAATSSDLLPGPGGVVDDVAAFDMLAYGLVVGRGREQRRRGGYFRGEFWAPPFRLEYSGRSWSGTAAEGGGFADEMGSVAATGGRALALVVFDSALDRPTEQELMSEGALEEVEPARSVLCQLRFAMPSPGSNGEAGPRRVPEYAVLVSVRTEERGGRQRKMPGANWFATRAA